MYFYEDFTNILHQIPVAMQYEANTVYAGNEEFEILRKSCNCMVKKRYIKE
jgi:hypothetical protein